MKPRILVFDSCCTITPCFRFQGYVVEQVDEFKDLRVPMPGTKGLSPAMDYSCKAANRAMLGISAYLDQLVSFHEPILRFLVM